MYAKGAPRIGYVTKQTHRQRGILATERWRDDSSLASPTRSIQRSTFPSPPNVVVFMTDYSYLYDSKFYSASVAGGVYTNPSLNQQPVVEQVNSDVRDILTDRLGLVPRRGPVPGSSAGLCATEGIGRQHCNHFIERFLN
jgi:hypothetical protein